MLHMIVNTHHAESCAFRSESDATALVGQFEQFEKLAATRGMTVQGSWVNRTHTRVLAVLATGDVEVPTQ